MGLGGTESASKAAQVNSQGGPQFGGYAPPQGQGGYAPPQGQGDYSSPQGQGGYFPPQGGYAPAPGYGAPPQGYGPPLPPGVSRYAKYLYGHLFYLNFCYIVTFYLLIF